MSRTTPYGFLTQYQNLEKTYDSIPRIRPDRRTEGQTNKSKVGWTDSIS